MVKSTISDNESEVPKNKQCKVSVEKDFLCSMAKMIKSLTSNKNLLKKSIKRVQEYLDLLEKPKALLVSSQICSICAFNFNNEDRVPICLPCGHSICKFCVHKMQHSSLTGICPYDRKEYFFIKELLPTNYSLLNSENLKENKICRQHGFEIVGYCKEHDMLLCGKCIFKHINHDFIEIESDETKAITDEKLKNFQEFSQYLTQIVTEWKQYLETAKFALQISEQKPNKWKKLVKSIEKHVNGDQSNASLENLVGIFTLKLESLLKISAIIGESDLIEQLSLTIKPKFEFSPPSLQEMDSIRSLFELSSPI